MSKFNKLAPFMNEFEQHITDLYALEKIVDATAASIEASDPDKTMNLLIGLKEMLRHQSDVLHSDFTKAWREFMTPNHVTKTWITEIGEDYVLTIPDFILKQLEWNEGDLLNIEALKNGTISITLASEGLDEGPGGCMGDTLTDEELKTIKEKGVLGLKAPWSPL